MSSIEDLYTFRRRRQYTTPLHVLSPLGVFLLRGIECFHMRSFRCNP